MGANKFTPGPWVRDTNSGLRCDVRAGSGRKVALCWGLSTSKGALNNSPAYQEECDANARLIAAAPELLDALKHSLEGWRDVVEFGLISPEHQERASALADEARAAILKAEA